MTRAKAQSWHDFKALRQLHGRNDPRTVAAWENFTAANNDIKHFSINSQKEYERTVAKQLGTAPKLFHGYIKHRRVGRPSVGPLRMQNGNLTDNPKTMANLFVNSFASQY